MQEKILQLNKEVKDFNFSEMKGWNMAIDSIINTINQIKK